MLLSEIVLNEIQTHFNSTHYNFFLFNAFNKKFTNAIDVSYNTQAFSEYKDKTICIFNVNNPAISITDFLSASMNYQLEFWYQTDNTVFNSKGEILSSPGYNVFEDINTWITDVNNTLVEIGDDYRLQMTFSEPVVNPAAEDTGVGKRTIVRVTGAINITDIGVFGRDDSIEIGITTGGTTTYYALPTITHMEMQASISPNQVLLQSSLISDQEIGSIANSLLVEYDDRFDTTNLAHAMLLQRAYGALTDETAYPIRIYRNNTLMAEYNAVLTVSRTATAGATSPVKIQVSFLRAEE